MKTNINNTKINYFDAFQWRWLSDKIVKWYTSFVIDMEQDGKRYVLIKHSLYYCNGVTGTECDKALEEYKKAINAERTGKTANQEKREIGSQLPIRIPAMQNLDGELWDVERSPWGAARPVSVTDEFVILFEPSKDNTKEPATTAAKQDNALADLSEYELLWKIKIATLKGDLQSLATLNAEQQKRIDSTKHLRID